MNRAEQSRAEQSRAEQSRGEERRGERRRDEGESTLGWIQGHYSAKAYVHMLIFSSHSSISLSCRDLKSRT